MLLNSLNFIFAFLPVVLILFYVVPGKWKNVVLALSSIFFMVSVSSLFSAAYLRVFSISSWQMNSSAFLDLLL